MKKRKVLLFGCSFSNHLKEVGFPEYTDHRGYGHLFCEVDYVINDSFVHGGNSNQRIVEDIYNYINSDDYSDSDILSIQWSYSNRLWIPSDLKDNHISFHGLDADNALARSNPGLKKPLSDFYTSYIGLFYDNNIMFKEHLKQIDLIRTYMDSKNVSYVQYLHSLNSHYSETSVNPGEFEDKKFDKEVLSTDYRNRNGKMNNKGSDYNTWIGITPETNSNTINLKDYNLQDIEGCVCLGDWVRKNNYEINYPDDIHLTAEADFELSKILIKKYKLL